MNNKRIECEIDRYMYDVIFSTKKLIKSKIQLLSIILESLRYIMYKSNTPLKGSFGKIIIYIDKMSRIFFFSDKKYYSVSLAMTVIENKQDCESKPKYEFELNGIRLTSQLISSLIQLLDSGIERLPSSFDFVDLIDEEEKKNGKEVWEILRDLILFEEGYIRYDKDINAYAEAVKRGQGDLHPENHLDICLRSGGQFKLGLHKELSENEFIDILNLKTSCKFLT